MAKSLVPATLPISMGLGNPQVGNGLAVTGTGIASSIVMPSSRVSEDAESST